MMLVGFRCFRADGAGTGSQDRLSRVGLAARKGMV